MLILGITVSHEAGAALVEDGVIVAAINEERLNRRKCSAGIPRLSLEWLFAKTGYHASDVDAIALAGLVHTETPPMSSDCVENGVVSPNMKLAESLTQNDLGIRIMQSPANVKLYRQISRLFRQKLRKDLQRRLKETGLKSPLFCCDHHTAHLASAYYTSGWNEALVISNDGFGDGYCSKVAVGRNGFLEEIDANPFYNSIGMYYLYITHLCGFPQYYHAGKTMGLAAFGDASKTEVFFDKSIIFDEKTGRYINQGLVFRKEIERMRKFFNGMPREDLAAGIQKHLEKLLVKQVQYFLKKTGLNHIALAGGVHANVRANQQIAAIPGVQGIFIHPNMGDGGLSVGAALWLWAKLARKQGEGSLPKKLSHVYFGPRYSNGEVEGVLDKAGIHYSKSIHVNREIALALSQGKIVARFDGRMEYGPRALGNRSILYSATDNSVNKWLNEKLRRTEFMPFAPVVRDRDAPAFFKAYGEATENAARFMTMTYDVTEKCRREAPAIVHIDGTARPQVIHKEDNPGYYAILEEYQELTGHSVLVNTSFNMHEEPIVSSPEDAIRAFQQSRIDVLVLNSFIVQSSKN